MKPRTAKRLSRTLVGLTTALATTATVLAMVNRHDPGSVIITSLIIIVLTTGYAVLGSLIVSPQPGNAIGWGFVGVGLLLASTGANLGFAAIALRSNPGSPMGLTAAWFSNWTYLPAILAIPWLFLLFPDGHLPTARWRPVAWTLAIASLVAVSALALQPDPTLNNLSDYHLRIPNPMALPFMWLGTLQAIAGITIIVCALLSVIALRRRAKNATPEVRQQVRWLKAVATMAGATLAIGVVLTIVPLGHEQGGGIPIFPIVLILFVAILALGIPIAAGVAILRYRLWALDVVVKKTVVALALTTLMLVPAALVLWIASQLVINGTSNTVAILVGGITLGVLALPLLRLSRRIASRIAYGRRATPYEVLAQFSGQVGETYSDDSVLPRMAKVLADGTGAASARVLLRVGPDLRAAAAVGEPAGPETLIPVIDRGDDLGVLALTMPPNDPMNPAKEQLAAHLAAQAGPVLRNVQLVEELRASRQRLVAAQDEERRKIERNLHDGVQQQLVAMNVQLSLLARVVASEPEKAVEMATLLQGRATEALDDLRDLARGIYPPLLADKGLAAALDGQARKAALPVAVEATDIDRYSPDVEATAYFCVLEALNNIAKYAEATSATVALVQEDGHLAFSVTDDGKGFEPDVGRHGTGLQGMADRLDAVGGSLDVTSRLGAGTTVSGRIPVLTSNEEART
jgi:signal transduction histidine kinase